MAQVADFVRKTQTPSVDIPEAARIHLGRCDSAGAIRRASKRITQALLDGKLDRDIHNAAQYGLVLMLKAVVTEAEDAERARERERLIPSTEQTNPLLNITFDDGGPGCVDSSSDDLDRLRELATAGKLPRAVADAILKAHDEREIDRGRRIHHEIVYGVRPPAEEPAIETTPEPTPPSQPIASPAPSPRAVASIPTQHAAPLPKAKPPTVEPVTTFEPTADDIMGPVFETTSEAAERALHRAVARSRVDQMMREAEEMRAHVESTNVRERRELAVREAKLAAEEGK